MDFGKIVKCFFALSSFFAIFFLTGCAGGRYHSAMLSGAPGSGIQALGSAPFFGWPLTGSVLARYGAKEEGVTLKGMVLEGSEGQEVLAAESGKIVFVDESLRGYGKTLIVEHAGGFSTVYARNSQILVAAGAWVKKGQPIARVGRAGKGDVPQVYFEVRRDSRPIDPQQVLK